jgi:hypothetical protein
MVLISFGVYSTCLFSEGDGPLHLALNQKNILAMNQSENSLAFGLAI